MGYLVFYAKTEFICLEPRLDFVSITVHRSVGSREVRVTDKYPQHTVLVLRINLWREDHLHKSRIIRGPKMEL